MKIRRLFCRITDSRGSSLIMALVTITILMLLGLAAITLSMSTLNSNAADATTNDSFYAAEAGVNNALDQLKLDVYRYYDEMKEASGTTYNTLYNNFAAKIVSNADNSFFEPDITAGYTNTSFTVESFDSVKNTYGFLVTTTSTMADGTKYQVQGRVKIKRLDVSAKDWSIPDAAIVVGNTLDLSTKGGISLSNGNAILGALQCRQPWFFGVSNGIISIDNTIGPNINDTLTYPSFSNPVISNPKYYITTNNTYLDASHYPLTYPVSVNTGPNVKLYLTNNNVIPDGVIRATGDLIVSSGGNIACDLYCNNLDITGRLLTGDIYARGNVVLHGGSFHGNIYADGNVTVSSADLQGSIVCGGSITVNGASALGNMFAAGPITMSSLGASGNVIYSKTKITLGGGSIDAIMFSGGDIVFNGGGNVNGAMIAKNNMYFSNDSWMSVNYNAASVQNKLAALQDSFFSSGSSSAELNSDIFQDQSITAIGRVN